MAPWLNPSLLFLIPLLHSNCISYAYIPNSNGLYPSLNPRVTQRSSLKRHFAYIYTGEDGSSLVEMEEEEQEDDNTQDTLFSSTSSSMFFSPSILNDLSPLENDKARLARLASAFPPTGMAIPIADLQDVTVLEVQESGITLSAVVRNGEQCVTIAVPIAFPSPCTTVHAGLGTSFLDEEPNNNDQQQQEQLQECILQNLTTLDEKAQSILHHQTQTEANYEDIEAYHRRANELQSSENIDLPSWWTPTSQESLTVESKSLRSLLNQVDFQPDVQSLAKYGIRLQIEQDYYNVLQAGIRCISSSGLMLGALIRDPEDEKEVENVNDAMYTVEVDVPIPFGEEVRSAGGLRDLVLDLVEALD